MDTNPLDLGFQGRRFIIGGTSPNIHNLNPEILETGVVIGLNRWPKFNLKTDLYLVCDTDSIMSEYPEVVHGVKCPKIMQKYDHVPNAPADIWFRKNHETIPTVWDGTLSFVYTCAFAAINFAALAGASEIVLFGVDFCAPGRADGSKYETQDHWESQEKRITDWLKRFDQTFNLPVYKTNPNSFLHYPLFSS
jgi:hypothetical protein